MVKELPVLFTHNCLQQDVAMRPEIIVYEFAETSGKPFVVGPIRSFVGYMEKMQLQDFIFKGLPKNNGVDEFILKP